MRRAFGVITTIKIPMTPELSPSARIIVHCTVNGNEVVADSLLIDPEDKLSNEVTRIYTRSRNLIITTITTLLLINNSNRSNSNDNNNNSDNDNNNNNNNHNHNKNNNINDNNNNNILFNLCSGVS